MYYKILEFHDKPGFLFRRFSEYNSMANVFEVLHFELKDNACLVDNLSTIFDRSRFSHKLGQSSSRSSRTI